MTTKQKFISAALISLSLSCHTFALPQERPASKRLTLAASKAVQGVVVRDAQFRSVSLARDMKYRLILPAGYDTTSRRYPVLYLLHGLMGSYVDWESRTRLTDYVKGLDLIVVMPDGNDAWYTNSVGDPQDRFEDYILKDLISTIDANYRTISTRHARAIAGLSMGGYGAMKFALKYPQMFAFAGSLSGALNAAGNIDLTRLPEKYAAGRMRIFGPVGGSARAENDVMMLIAKVPDPARLPYLYLDCGTSDPLLKANHEFVSSLPPQNISYEFHEVPGAHTWQYWDQQVKEMLRSLQRHMEIKGPVRD